MDMDDHSRPRQPCSLGQWLQTVIQVLMGTTQILVMDNIRPITSPEEMARISSRSLKVTPPTPNSNVLSIHLTSRNTNNPVLKDITVAHRVLDTLVTDLIPHRQSGNSSNNSLTIPLRVVTAKALDKVTLCMDQRRILIIIQEMLTATRPVILPQVARIRRHRRRHSRETFSLQLDHPLRKLWLHPRLLQ